MPSPHTATDRPTHAVLRDLEPGDRVEMIVDGDARYTGTVSGTDDVPGTPGVLMNWDRQVSANVEDDGFEEPGDLHSWHLSTRRVDGEWDEPLATGWFDEGEDEGMVESASQPLTDLRILPADGDEQ